MKLKAVWEVIKETGTEFSQDRVPRLAAATAYYAIFSIGPLLVLIVGVAGLVFGEETVRKEVYRQMQAVVGEKSASIVGSMMSAQKKGGSLMATVIGAVALVLGASGVFGQLQDSLNTIWGVTTKPGQGIWAFIRNRFFSVTTVLGIGFLLLISMALSAFVNAFANYLGTLMSLPNWVPRALEALLTFAVISILFALIFKVLPDVKIRWRYVWLGAVVTSLLFTTGKFLLGFYLSRQASASAYGAGSAFVIILLYIYYSSLILYVGAEFTRAYARRFGSGIQPSPYAVKITDEQRAEEGMPRQKQVEQAARTSDAPPKASSKGPETGTAPAVEGYPGPTPAAEPALAASTQPYGRYMRVRPWTSVSVAWAIGLVVGLLYRGKAER